LFFFGGENVHWGGIEGEMLHLTSPRGVPEGGRRPRGLGRRRGQRRGRRRGRRGRRGRGTRPAPARTRSRGGGQSPAC